MAKLLQSKRTLKIDKNKALTKISTPQMSIWWFFQWLKLTLDYEKKGIQFEDRFIASEGGGTKKRIIKYKVKAWNKINLDELRKLPPILKWEKKTLFSFLRLQFTKYQYLFNESTVRVVKSKKDLIESEDYFTLQIPSHKNITDIANEIQKLVDEKIIKRTERKTKEINFYRAVKSIELQRMFDVFKYKETTSLKNEDIAKKLKYRTGDPYLIGKEGTQKAGIRQVQLAYRSAKILLINMAKGQFPKNTID